ncbi:HNH-2 domain-containing protein [Pyrenophora tritici-repentis]|uniref:HNH endonuclease n=2 Tax=Pyrenophora tritici-repentis TaxID=45151 RepID=A0A2W1CYF1_9PLEO|nr:uncharacterized protein PTRG_12131 [Pyrenophora tritici-repentis Pt-1C-BFP]KAA8621926.1 HNH-2 domain-containing protein [Pyrenophora tritici-repentis]EDU47324.1 conserved hypothetical protein [Pyrenophora tritici-repentis Pt-1C-BFP]KAF7573842.1 HNH-2 domain containing protein [Pyrenophora tritici-repentis]KAI0604200.1 HNH-2 domain-containing protein [Pyrenophora tritici-repentis]KAI0616982.1 HNH-2 domain-containing protein [Pyrenophora tritici-repentis]
MPYARPPAPPPLLPDSPPRRHILFRHPGYDDSNNVLFKLYAIDAATVGSHDGEEETSQRPGTSGLYAQFALDACAILAGNRFNGWLSTSRNPDEARDARVDAGSTLVARSYYYHLDRDDDIDGPDGPYRIVPNFREWRFPHEDIPAHWVQLSANATAQDSTFSRSNLTLALQIRDGSCRISGYREELQVAHIVPQAELDWWMANSMSQYNRSSTSSMDDTGNAMLLQASLHIAFDRPRFVFVPKPSGNDDGMRLVLHLLEPSAEFAHLYHNRELHQSDVGVEMLFARFAWTLFPLLEAFLSCKKDRRLTVRTTSHDQVLDGGYFTAAACERFSMSSTRTRSVSPKKRKPDEGAIDSNSVDDIDVRKPIQPSDDTNTSGFAPNLRKRSIGCIDHEPPMPCQTPGSNKRRKASPVPEQSSFSSTVSPTSPTECSTHSHDDAEESCIVVSHNSQLAQQWLEKERERSDPEQTWTKDMLWVQEVWAGKTIASHEVPRFWNLSGYEVRDMGSDDLLAGVGPAE